MTANRKTRGLRTSLFCTLFGVCILTLGSTHLIAQDIARRGDVVEIDKQLKDIMIQNRVMGIRRASTLDDVQLIKDFQILETLLSFVEDKNQNIRVRSEALESLVTLFSNGIGKPDTLEIMAAVVEDDENQPLIRMDALRLIGKLASGDTLQVEKVFNLLKKIEKRANRLTDKLAARLYEAFGGFDKMKDVREIILTGLKDRRPIVRAGALRGLGEYLARSSDTSSTVSRALVKYLQSAESVEERAEVIDALRELQQNGATFRGDTVKEALIKIVKTGEDQEVQAAVRFLIRIADEEIVETLLTYAKPGARKLNFKSQHLFNMSLIEGLSLLASIRDTDKATKLTDEIVKHFITLLKPSNDVPDIIRQTAIFGLGCIPYKFDRSNAFKILVKLLEIEKNDEMIDEIEKSLKALMGDDPFVIVHPLTGKTKPDIEAYQEWFKVNGINLEANKTPWNPGK